MKTTTISQHTAAIVLGYRTYGKLGMYPGGFEETILNAFHKADSRNYERLILGFPEYDTAFGMSDEELKVIAYGEEV